MVAQHEDVPAFEILREQTDAFVRVRVRGELDISNAFELTRAVVGAGMEHADRPVALDLSEVVYLDSTGVRALIDARAALEQEIILVRPSAPVRRVLELTRLLETFAVRDDGEQGPR